MKSMFKSAISIVSLLIGCSIAYSRPVNSALGANERNTFEQNVNPLPPGLTAVEYIASTGRQGIDTKLRPPTSDCIVRMSFQLTSTSGDKSLIGTGGGGDRMYFGINSAKWFYGCVDYAYGKSADLLRHECIAVWHPNDGYVLLDGTEIVRINKPAFNPYYKTMGLFTRNLGDFYSYSIAGRIYWCTIETRDGVVRDFIPVRFTNEQGVSEGAMFDRANPTVGVNPDGSVRDDGLYRNRGTGAFVIGPDL